MTKQEIRKKIKILLKENSSKLPEFSKLICELIISSDIYKNSNCVLAYMSLSDEVDLQPVIQNALNCGKKVFLPKVDPQSTNMEFYQYSEANQTTEGAFGIQEPEKSIPFNINTESHVLALVPGRGFSANGARLGRGKAYYDTYFKTIKEKLLMAGICFSLQMQTELPTEAHDIYMNYIITEKGIIKTEK